MNKSESIASLAKALHKAQHEITGAVKDSSNPFFKSKYANLESVIEAVKEPLFKNGLCYVQSSAVTETGQLVLVTMLIHESGEWISGDYLVKGTKEDPQALGSATSYARRYALSAMLGVAQIDDDAEAATHRPQAKPAQAHPGHGSTHQTNTRPGPFGPIQNNFGGPTR